MSEPTRPSPAADGPAPPRIDDVPEVASANARAGLWLFGVYLMIYGGFVGLCAFAPRLMAATIPGGLNVAVAYGLGLIAAAFVLALVYMAACRRIVGRHGEGARR